ncbi:hypothetical protein BVC93_21600 [Mycobacterium sp. MS1601]|uniref:cytochrome c oxidase subunit 3 n=1 Tax=Mycobacterium sp. MS1601 TaxID=1936029 RepID=UPI00097960E5|nr:cytochrome c oxidase subunit 3 [Mycobacterium sp. MS1601]AQA04589.1 hypothetical protein BVC93_21600 [Mycobacterium sp. MS1601]
MTSLATRRVPGEQGTWVFLFGDMLVFAVIFSTFLVERASAPEVFDAGRRTLHLDVGLVNTLVLLSSSLCVVVYLAALRARDSAVAFRAVVAAIGCGALFVGLKLYEYTSLAGAGHGPGASDFYLYYFILTGLHLFHVCVGMAVLVLLATQARLTGPVAEPEARGRQRAGPNKPGPVADPEARGRQRAGPTTTGPVAEPEARGRQRAGPTVIQLSDTRMALIEGGGCFWHLVDLLWIVLFPLLYLVS